MRNTIGTSYIAAPVNRLNQNLAILTVHADSSASGDEPGNDLHRLTKSVPSKFRPSCVCPDFTPDTLKTGGFLTACPNILAFL